MVNLAITANAKHLRVRRTDLRGPYGPLPFEGAIRLLIEEKLLWNFSFWNFLFPFKLVYHSFLICIYNKKELLIGL